MPRAQPPPVTLDDEPIAWKQEVKYLGVTLDSRLNFGPHAKKKVAEAKQIAGSLGPLIGRRSSLPVRVKTTIFLAVVRSLMMYACTAWWANCSQTNRRTLETVQNKALRSISKQPWFVRNASIRNALQVPTLEVFAYTTSAKFFETAAASTHQHIVDIAAQHDGPDDYRRRPIAILDDPP